jgi:hypothetical protein
MPGCANTRGSRCFLICGVGLTAVFWLVACGGPVAPLTVGPTGIATSAILDKLDDKATHVIGEAASAASLVSTKAARDAQLLIGAARQQFHDELNDNWDRLDSQKISILRAIDQSLSRINENVKAGGKIEDKIFLDINAELQRLPFSKDVPSVRRIEGASQYYRETGLYRLVITGSVFTPFGRPASISIDGKEVDSQWLSPTPPYDMVVNIPAEFLRGRFSDNSLSYVPITIKTDVSNRSSKLFFWRDAVRPAAFTFKMELFPKYPVKYRVTEYRKEKIVDYQAPVEIQKGPISTINGCGNDGCNAYNDICTDVPSGAEPIEIVARYDSARLGYFSGMGPDRKTPTGMCTLYWQHSHNITRNVSIDVSYHPAGAAVRQYDVFLRPLSIDPSSQSQTPLFSKDAIQVGSGGRVIQIGKTYSADFSSEMQSYDIILRTFTGEDLVVTPGAAPGEFIHVSSEDKTAFKRTTVLLTLPW